MTLTGKQQIRLVLLQSLVADEGFEGEGFGGQVGERLYPSVASCTGCGRLEGEDVCSPLALMQELPDVGREVLPRLSRPRVPLGKFPAHLLLQTQSFSSPAASSEAATVTSLNLFVCKNMRIKKFAMKLCVYETIKDVFLSPSLKS
jgi:hypothetical protein